MAIIIPSSKIYGINNQKVRDNQLDRIEINANNIMPNNDYETPVFNLDCLEPLQWGEKQSDRNSKIAAINHPSYNLAGTYVSLEPVYTEQNIKIPILGKNKYIDSLLLGKNKDGNDNIKYTIFGDYITGTANSFVDITDSGSLGSIYGINLQRTDIKENQAYILPDKEVKHTFTYGGSAASATSQTSVILNDLTNLSTVKATKQTINGIDYFVLNIKLLVGIQIIKLSLGTLFTSGYAQTKVPFNGTYEDYQPKKITITFYGNTIGINIEDKKVVIGNEAGEKPFAVDSNELVQTSNYIKGTNENFINKIYNDTLVKYKKGQETATINCSVSDYYNEDNEQEIFATTNFKKIANPKCFFEIGDIVSPMILNNKGQDVSMSANKLFKVLGNKISYDGEILQTLYLKEKPHNFYIIQAKSVAEPESAESFIGFKFDIIGNGNIVINKENIYPVNHETLMTKKIPWSTNELCTIEFIGTFSQINIDIYSIPGGGVKPMCDLQNIISFDNYLTKTYVGMFNNLDQSEKWLSLIPDYITTISTNTFSQGHVSQGTITIPSTIKQIDKHAFDNIKNLIDLKFDHAENDQITLLPNAFYQKNAINVNIYTNNATIKNYDWKSDNITATLYHLDGTAWS